MSKRNRKRYSAEFKAKVALAALKEDATLSEIAARFEIHPNMVSLWKRQTVEGMSSLFTGRRSGTRCPRDPDQGTAREDRTTDGGTRFFSTRLRSMSRDRRKSVVETNHPRLGVVRQCRLLGLCRSTFYYKTAGETPKNLALMKRLDEIFLDVPFFGARQMARMLRREGYWVNRKRIVRLMRKMGLEAVYRRPNTSRPHPEHKIFPYLLRDMAITRANQVWCTDVTYIPMRRGFLYLVAIMDWHSRKVLSWQLSNSMDASFCVEALSEALERYGTPEIFNTDQGSQFTSTEFVGVLENAGVRVSMDGRGRWMDNVMVESCGGR
jgi:putative transposase